MPISAQVNVLRLGQLFELRNDHRMFGRHVRGFSHIRVEMTKLLVREL